jgi:hypothetical protein
MNKRSFLELLLLIGLINFTIGCTGRDKEDKTVRVSSLLYPPDTIAFAGVKEMDLDSFPNKHVSNREYVNLEGDSSFVLVNKVINKKDRIYILDQRQAIIAIYDSLGKLHSIIKGKTDFSKISDFMVDNNGKIYVLDGKFERVLCYDSSYKLLTRKDLPFETDIIYRLENGNFLVGLSSWNDRANMHNQLIQTDSVFTVLNKYLKYDDFVDHNYWIKGYRFLLADNAIYYNRPINNVVYVLSLNGDIVKSYYFDFGNKNVPNKDKINIEANYTKYLNYRLLANFTFINEKFALGQIWDKRKFRFFYLDRINKVIFLEDINRSNELKYLGDFDGTNLVSIIYPGEFNETDYRHLPVEQKQWLKKGGYVFCKYLLK